MITKAASRVWSDYARDEAVERLSEPAVTRTKGLGIGSALGGLAGAGASLLAGKRNLGRALIGGGLGATLGAGAGELAHRSDAEERGNAKGYLRRYNTNRMRELLSQRRNQLRNYMFQQRRQAAQAPKTPATDKKSE